MATAREVVLEVKGLTKYFPLYTGFVRRRHAADVKAVDGVTFDVRQGETLGLVGESGCGKSTLGRCVLQLLRATTGEVLFDGEDLTRLSPNALRPYRRHFQMIFQDPYDSLNPRFTAADVIGEPLRIHHALEGREYQNRVAELLDIGGPGTLHGRPVSARIQRRSAAAPGDCAGARTTTTFHRV